MRLRFLVLVLLALAPATAALASCEDDLVATGEYANVVIAGRTAAEKEVAILRVRLQQAEARAAKAEAALAAKTAPSTEPTKP